MVRLRHPSPNYVDNLGATCDGALLWWCTAVVARCCDGALLWWRTAVMAHSCGGPHCCGGPLLVAMIHLVAMSTPPLWATSAQVALRLVPGARYCAMLCAGHPLLDASTYWYPAPCMPFKLAQINNGNCLEYHDACPWKILPRPMVTLLTGSVCSHQR